MPSRNLPSIRYLNTAAESLPDADSWPDDNYVINLEKQKMELSFHKIKLSKERDGRRYRWAYEGKVIVK